MVQKCHFWQFQILRTLVSYGLERCFLLKSNFSTSKIAKNYIFGPFEFAKSNFRQNRSGGKIIKFQHSQALTSHIESFWSLVPPIKLFSSTLIKTFCICFYSIPLKKLYSFLPAYLFKRHNIRSSPIASKCQHHVHFFCDGFFFCKLCKVFEKKQYYSLSFFSLQRSFQKIFLMLFYFLCFTLLTFLKKISKQKVYE